MPVWTIREEGKLYLLCETNRDLEEPRRGMCRGQ